MLYEVKAVSQSEIIVGILSSHWTELCLIFLELRGEVFI